MDSSDKPPAQREQRPAGRDATAAAQALRQQAEARFGEKAARSPLDLDALSPEATRQMLHELRVHQIELEMQNEELQESQAALDRARARYFDLYDLAPVGYCTVSEQGLILECNLTLASLLGVARGALVRQPFFRAILKEDQDIYYRLRKQLVESGEPQTCDLRMVKHDETQFWAHLAASISQRHEARELRIVLVDVTQRKQTEEKLRIAANVFSHTREGIMITAADGTIIDVNDTFTRITGYSREEAVGQTPHLLSSGRHDREFHAAMWQALIENGHWYGEIWNRRKNGEIYPETLTISAVSGAEDKPRQYVAMFFDSTERKRVEAERERLNQTLLDKNVELVRSTRMAEKANMAKSDFLASMSHELRTPLHGILGFAQLIEAGSPEPTPGQKRSIDQILKAGWHLLELINEILDLSVIESGKLSLLLEPVSLAAVLVECELMIEPQAQKRGIRVTIGKLGTGCFVTAERLRLKQVLINLLSNAIKYNKAGGAVTVECTPRLPDSIRISIRDTGAGLAPKLLPHLFEAFNRLGQEAKAEEGTGIGLVVSKRLVELMGGEIGVESVLGEGSVFWIDLKRAPEPGGGTLAEAAEAAAPAEVGAQGTAPAHTVLYVEDNPANLMLVEDILARRPDIRVLSARDSASGIELARSALPEVILLDINMQGLGGIDVLKVLAEDPATARIPVIALTANAMPEDIAKGLAAGFFGYITKPIKIDAFMDALDVALISSQRS